MNILVKSSFFLVLAAACSISCKKDKDPETTRTISENPAKQALLGVWTDEISGSPFEVIFRDTGYRIDASGHTFEWGDYSFSGDTLFLDPASSAWCGSVNGKYMCTISGDSLDFNKVVDTCNYRAGVLNIIYTRQ